MQLFKIKSAKIGSFIYINWTKNYTMSGLLAMAFCCTFLYVCIRTIKIDKTFILVFIDILYYKTPIVQYLKIAIYISLKLL